MRRVLLVSFFFPPTSVVGAIRAAKLAKYLPQHGWAPTVLTVDRFVSRPQTMAIEEPSPKIVRARFVDPVGAIVARRRGESRRPALPKQTAISFLGRLRGLARDLPGINVVHVPDRAISWYPAAVKAGLRALETESYDAILSTSPPPTAHLVAASLARKSGVGWVADLRDLWSTNAAVDLPPWLTGVEGWIERRVLRHARSLVTVTPVWAKQLEAMHGKRTQVITNGFDPEETPSAPPPMLPRMTLTYTGAIYAKHQDSEPLFEGIARLRQRRRITADELVLRFYGSEHEQLPPLVERYHLGDLVELHGLVSREEALARQRESAALVVFEWNSAKERGWFPLKSFEYLPTRRPVLVIGYHDEGLLSELMTETKTGEICTSAEAVATTLDRWLDVFQEQGCLPAVGEERVIAQYSWPRLAKTLADELERATLARD